MSQFTDRLGETWFLTITVGTIRRVKTLLKIDLYALIDDKCRPLFELLGDLERFIDLLFVLTHPAAKIGGDRQAADDAAEHKFAEAFDGTTLEEAGRVFLEALADFFPSPRRETLQKLFLKALTVGDRTTELARVKAETLLDAIDPEQAAEQVLARWQNNGSGSLRASSESIRIHSP